MPEASLRSLDPQFARVLTLTAVDVWTKSTCSSWFPVAQVADRIRSPTTNLFTSGSVWTQPFKSEFEWIKNHWT